MKVCRDLNSCDQHPVNSYAYHHKECLERKGKQSSQIIGSNLSPLPVSKGRKGDRRYRDIQVNLNHTRIQDYRDQNRDQLQAKARYRQEAATARVEQTGIDELTIEFTTPQRAVAPGQSLVLYDGEYLVGGGKIEAAL